MEGPTTVSRLIFPSILSPIHKYKRRTAVAASQSASNQAPQANVDPEQSASGQPSSPSMPEPPSAIHGSAQEGYLPPSAPKLQKVSLHSGSSSESSLTDPSGVSEDDEDDEGYDDSIEPDILQISFGLPHTTSRKPAQWPEAVLSMYGKDGKPAMVAENFEITSSRPLDRVIEDLWDGPKRLIVNFYLEEAFRAEGNAVDGDVIHRDIEQCLRTLQPLLAEWEFGFTSEEEDELEVWDSLVKSTRNVRLLAKFMSIAKDAGFKPREGYPGQDRAGRWWQGEQFMVIRFVIECQG
ncbi:uncharacterized protein LTR77_003177 [Saxophila tyrrhenica]|uniref:Uncharacterized protein n=1 Tax=Saxophila tyrrhenica TaxID=1690608 RepID=A0AAV9PL97_9PEZI|nr:hypothetical protein LTR77_003177 [Saxophila tyrrhenica]